jgi:hypothetical protein
MLAQPGTTISEACPARQHYESNQWKDIFHRIWPLFLVDRGGDDRIDGFHGVRAK